MTLEQIQVILYQRFGPLLYAMDWRGYGAGAGIREIAGRAGELEPPTK